MKKQQAFPTLKTQRLELIEINEYHQSDLFEILSNESITRFCGVDSLKNIQEAETTIQWFKNLFTNKLGIRWGIQLHNQNNIIGTLGFNSFEKNNTATIGYELHPAHWNKGYTTEALDTVIKYGFKELQIKKIEAGVMVSNVASEKVLLKLGFKKETGQINTITWKENTYDLFLFVLHKDH